jgi:kynureninase
MIELLKWGKKLVAILADGKVTKAELPEFLEALAGVIGAVVSIIVPYLGGKASTIARRLAAGVNLAAGK